MSAPVEHECIVCADIHEDDFWCDCDTKNRICLNCCCTDCCPTHEYIPCNVNNATVITAILDDDVDDLPF